MLALGCLSIGIAAPVGKLQTGPQVGDQTLSDFYQWNSEAPSRAGVLLRQEPMHAALIPEHASLGARILYSSMDGRWNSGVIPVSGAVYLPKGPTPKNGWPLIAWAHGTVGMADTCAPSWTGSNERDRSYIDRWLTAGYAVVAPDYQGLGGPGPHPYTNWRAEGQSVLDGARAALSMDERINNRIVLTGQSQGSGATLGAARIAARYAPDLKIAGAIATALITTFPKPGVPNGPAPEDSPHFTIYRLLGGGLPAESSDISRHLTQKGKLLLQSVLVGCSPRPVAEREGITVDNAFIDPVGLAARLGPIGAQTPFLTSISLFIGTGLADELISPSRQKAAVGALCAAGNKVQWRGYEAANHSGTLLASFADAELFARAAMKGELPASQCTASNFDRN